MNMGVAMVSGVFVDRGQGTKEGDLFTTLLCVRDWAAVRALAPGQGSEHLAVLIRLLARGHNEQNRSEDKGMHVCGYLHCLPGAGGRKSKGRFISLSSLRSRPSFTLL